LALCLDERTLRPGGGAFTDLSVKLGERSVAAVHASAGGQRALGGRGHGLPLGPVAAAGQLSAQGAAVLGGGAWAERTEEDSSERVHASGGRAGGADAVLGAGGRVLRLLTYAQSAAGAHGAARLAAVLGDGGDADGAAEAGAALLNTDVLVFTRTKHTTQSAVQGER